MGGGGGMWCYDFDQCRRPGSIVAILCCHLVAFAAAFAPKTGSHPMKILIKLLAIVLYENLLNAGAQQVLLIDAGYRRNEPTINSNLTLLQYNSIDVNGAGMTSMGCYTMALL